MPYTLQNNTDIMPSINLKNHTKVFNCDTPSYLEETYILIKINVKTSSVGDFIVPSMVDKFISFIAIEK